MPRKQRIKIEGLYHVVNRGVGRRDIFMEHGDYEKFLELLGDLRKSYDITVQAYCLMSNHYHILIETHDENISEAIKYLNSFYSMYFNKKYKRSGHLWQGRFNSYYLYDDAHFWVVAKYIERNPIKANMVDDISDYSYQSFYMWKNTKESELLNNSKIKDMTLKEYEEYIDSELHVDALDTVYISPRQVKVDGEYKVLLKRVETFFEQDRDINRNQNIKKAYEYGYRKTEIALFVGLHPNSVAKIV